MGQWLIVALALLGLVAPLIPSWRAVLLSTLLFALANWAVLSHLHALLAAEPNPGPGARGIALLGYVPTAALLLACLFRMLFEAIRYMFRRQRDRSLPAGIDNLS